MNRLMLIIACFLLLSGPGDAASVERFSFWTGDGAEKAPGFQGRYGHPCGETVEAKVSKLPTAQKGPFISETVVELNASGKVIRRWPMPVNYFPLALQGSELLVAFGEKGFWVRPNGAFKKASTIPPVEDQLPFTCNLTSVFGKSNYARCGVFIDLISRKKRMLGYEGVCT